MDSMIGIRFRGIGIVGLLLAMGCFGERDGVANSVAPDLAIGPVTAAPRNAIVVVGGTVQLSMSAISLTGVPLTTVDSVAYRLANAGDTAVRVGPTGLVTGALAATSIPVNVVVFRNGTYNGDQVLVTVTPSVIPGLTLSIQPPAGDSAKQAMGIVKTIVPVLRNPVTGQSLSGIQLGYSVNAGDVDRLGVYTGSVRIRDLASAGTVHQARSPAAARNQIVPYVPNGGVWVYASVHTYGTLLQDSVRYTFTYPYTGTVAISKSSLAVLTAISGGTGVSASLLPDVLLAPAGVVTFTNNASAGDPLTVVYTLDNPAAATAASPASTVGGASGNVSTLAAQTSSRRQFLTPGTYRWTMVTSGGPAPWSGQTASGAIVVK